MILCSSCSWVSMVRSCSSQSPTAKYGRHTDKITHTHTPPPLSPTQLTSPFPTNRRRNSKRLPFLPPPHRPLAPPDHTPPTPHHPPRNRRSKLPPPHPSPSRTDSPAHLDRIGPQSQVPPELAGVQRESQNRCWDVKNGFLRRHECLRV